MNENIFECRGLSKNYGSTQVLKNVSFGLTRGKIVGLLGPNGSGKTTLIKLANGLLTPTSGGIFINGKKPGVETKKAVSYLADCVCLPDWMTIDELISFFEGFYDNFNAPKAHEMINNLNLDSTKKLKTLSKGNKEKVQLILTMSRDADLYLLDEPMGGVDPVTREYILNTIISNYNQNSTVVISTHLISEVEKILDEFIFINNGEIVMQDAVDNVRSERAMSIDSLFREVFKC